MPSKVLPPSLPPRRISNPGLSEQCMRQALLSLSPSPAFSPSTAYRHFHFLPPSSKHLLSHPLNQNPSKKQLTQLLPPASRLLSLANSPYHMQKKAIVTAFPHCIIRTNTPVTRGILPSIRNSIPYRQELQPTTTAATAIRRGPSLPYRNIPSSTSPSTGGATAQSSRCLRDLL